MPFCTVIVIILLKMQCDTHTRVCWREEFFLCVLGIPTGATWKIAMTCFFLGKLCVKEFRRAVALHCIPHDMFSIIYFLFYFSVFSFVLFSFPIYNTPSPVFHNREPAAAADVGEESRGAACVQLKSCPSTHFVYLRIANCPLPFHDLCRVSFFLKGSGRTALEIRPRSCCASIDLFPPTFFLNWPFSQSSKHQMLTQLFRAFKTFWPLRASSVDNHKDDCVEFQK
jgi:hypothetical protein